MVEISIVTARYRFVSGDMGLKLCYHLVVGGPRIGQLADRYVLLVCVGTSNPGLTVIRSIAFPRCVTIVVL
ncbi:hypothetical protein GW17_00053781 [Ensete ventricosum]|nr:hypothetical protein GW17_00053781 [Ensete ventricosum]